MTLSVIVITKNEEESIRDCLESVVWADEIIVVDSGSTDNTVAICREYTSKVFVTGWPGFGAQKNHALEMTTSDWVLSLDADEGVTPELRAEIQAAISDPGANVAFKMPRLSNYCGRYMRHSGWWPDYIIRLFRRGQGHFSNDLVHEHLIVNGTYILRAGFLDGREGFMLAVSNAEGTYYKYLKLMYLERSEKPE